MIFLQKIAHSLHVVSQKILFIQTFSYDSPNCTFNYARKNAALWKRHLPTQCSLGKTFHDGAGGIKRKLLYHFLSYVRMNGHLSLRQSLWIQTLPSSWRSAEQASCPSLILIRVVQDGDQLLLSIRRYLHSAFSAFVAGLHISF